MKQKRQFAMWGEEEPNELCLDNLRLHDSHLRILKGDCTQKSEDHTIVCSVSYSYCSDIWDQHSSDALEMIYICGP